MRNFMSELEGVCNIWDIGIETTMDMLRAY